MDLMRNGGFRWVDESKMTSRSAPANFTPPQLFSACNAVTLRGAGNAEVPDPNKVVMKLHINWGHASATQIKRVLGDAERSNMRPLTHSVPDPTRGRCGVAARYVQGI